VKKVYSILIVLLALIQIVSAQMVEADTISYSINIDDVVITSQHKPTSTKNSVHLVQVIKKEEIQNKGFTQLDQVLTQLSSVRINYDPILGSSAKMRGIGSDNIAILIDGVPVIGRLDGALDLSQITMSNIEQIEIIEGPQSIIYGNNAAGGVINLITKKSQLETFRLELSSNWEFPLVQNQALNAGFKIKDFFFNVGATYLLDQPYEIDSLRVFETIELNDGNSLKRKVYPWNPKERMSAYANVRYMIDEVNSVSFKYSHMDEEVSNFGEKRRPVFKPYSFDEFYLTNRTDYSAIYQGQIKNLAVNTTLALNEFNRTLAQERYEFETEEFNEEFSNADSSYFRSLFGKSSVSYSPSQKSSLLAGFQINQELGEGDRIIDFSQADSTKVKSLEYALFSDFKYDFSHTKLSTGFRLSNHSIYGLQFSPSIQAQHQLSKNWNLRAGYSRGFRSPGLKELYINFIDVNHYVVGNQELLPELANDFNLSLSYDKKSNADLNYSGTLKLYRTDISNRIILSEFEQLKFKYQNLNNYSVHGGSLDLSISYKGLTASNNFGLGYWYNEISEIRESPNYNQVIDNTFSLNFNPINKNFGAVLVHRKLGDLPRYFIENDELKQTTTRGYQFLDLSFYTDLLNDNLKINFGVRNLMNVVYAEINQLDSGANHALDPNASNQLVGRGRTYFIGCKYLLKIKSK